MQPAPLTTPCAGLAHAAVPMALGNGQNIGQANMAIVNVSSLSQHGFLVLRLIRQILACTGSRLQQYILCLACSL